MDFRFGEAEEAFQGELLDFLDQELPDDWDALAQTSPFSESNFPFTKEMSSKLAGKGWLTLAWPEEYGGQGRSYMEQLVYREEMTYRNVPGTDLGVGAISWVGPTLMLAGSEEQRREHLPPIARAERYWCTLYSEPGSGSDLASLQTQAVRDGDDYVVNGSKIWTSAGHVADWGWLAARTDNDAPKHRGISLFLLDMKTPGVTVRPIYNMAGSHEFNEVFFDNVRVPKRNLVGEENRGWYTLAVALDFERSGVGYSATARRTLGALTEYARQTERSGRPLAEDPMVRTKLAQRSLEAEISRGMSYRVAWMQSQGMVPNAEASMSKLFGTELFERAGRAAGGGPGSQEGRMIWSALIRTIVRQSSGPSGSDRSCSCRSWRRLRR